MIGSKLCTNAYGSVPLIKVYTSSYDCTIRSLSFTSGVSREIFSMDDGTLISSIDLTPSGHEMWISDSQGGATHMDLRESKDKSRWYGLSDTKIGCISINPTRPHFLLTASNNRSLKWACFEVDYTLYIPTDPATQEFGMPGTCNRWLQTSLTIHHLLHLHHLQGGLIQTPRQIISEGSLIRSRLQIISRPSRANPAFVQNGGMTRV